MIYLPRRDLAPLSHAVFKEQLLRNPRILGVTATRHPPTSIMASDTSADWDGRNPDLKYRISFASVDFDYPETLKIERAAPFAEFLISLITPSRVKNREIRSKGKINPFDPN